MRPACTGKPNGPNLYHLPEVLGREKVVGRIEGAMAQPGFVARKLAIANP